MPDVLSCHIIGIKVYISKPTESSKIVKSSHMIIMGMGKQHTINLTEWNSQQLLTGIWSAVDQQTR